MSVADLSYINLSELGNTIKMVGMILEQNDDTFLLLLPENDVQDNITTLELSHEDWKAIINQLDFKETEVLIEDEGNIKKTIIRKCNRQIKNSVAWNVYRRDNYTCRYCGRNDVPLTVDHLVLWEKGGPSIEENLVASCKRCNNKRGNMEYGDWITSAYYREISRDLHHLSKASNIYLITAIDRIPKRFHKRKR